MGGSGIRWIYSVLFFKWCLCLLWFCSRSGTVMNMNCCKNNWNCIWFWNCFSRLKECDMDLIPGYLICGYLIVDIWFGSCLVDIWFESVYSSQIAWNAKCTWTILHLETCLSKSHQHKVDTNAKWHRQWPSCPITTMNATTSPEQQYQCLCPSGSTPTSHPDDPAWRNARSWLNNENTWNWKCACRQHKKNSQHKQTTNKHVVSLPHPPQNINRVYIRRACRTRRRKCPHMRPAYDIRRICVLHMTFVLHMTRCKN